MDADGGGKRRVMRNTHVNGRIPSIDWQRLP
jgi:hypothetical protein